MKQSLKHCNANSIIQCTKTFVFLFLPLSFSSCNRIGESGNECFKYPTQIDSLQVRDLYDSARWYLYTWLGDREYLGHYMGELEMQYNSFFASNDSLEIFFTLHLTTSLAKPNERIGNISKCSMGFNLKTRRKLWGWDINGFSSELLAGDIRFDNPRSSEVVSFIKTHKEKLNRCFLELAKKMEIIKE